MSWLLNSISVKLSDLVWKLRHCLWTWRIKTLLCRFLVLLSLLRLPVWKQRKKEVWISKYVVVYIFTNFATYSAAAIWPHKVFFSVYSFLVVSRNFNYAINFSCNAVNFNFADSCHTVNYHFEMQLKKMTLEKKYFALMI